MQDNTRKTRREIQAELKQQKKSQPTSDYNSTSSTDDQQTTKLNKSKKSIFALLLLIETILVLILFNFLGWKIVIVLALIPFIFCLLNRRNSAKGKKRPKGTMVVFIIYLILIGLGIRTNGVLSSLVSTSQSNEFYVMALEDDEVSDVSEIEPGSSVALGNETSYSTNIFPQAKFAEEGYDFVYTAYQSSADEASALMAGQERFIVVQNPKSDELKDIEGFESSTKVIGHYTEQVDIQTGDKNVNHQTFTVLLTGTDTRSDAIDSNSRSDAIMVATVNPKSSTAALVSIPRDAYVESSCIGGYDKITHSSLNGMNCLIDDVENLLGVEIDYYLKVNFFTVIDAIDAVGGIDVEVETAFCGQDEYDNLNAYCFEPGTQHLNGSEALSYARERHSFADGDYARADHQQQVINGFLEALMNSGPLAINSLLDVASSSARTNLSASQLTDIAKLLQRSGGFTLDTYTIDGYGSYADLPYWGLYGSSVQILDEASIAEAQAKLAAV